MIRVICPNCQAKLDAKEELVGQTRDCPRCGASVVIRPAAEGAFPQGPRESDAEARAPADIALAPLAHVDAPARLERLNSYLICDSSRIVAAWENNGQGWRLKTSHGFASAARNPQQIPSQGDFKLVELRMVRSGGDHRLTGIRVYQLAKHWALAGLGRGDDWVCQSIVGMGALLRAQKDAVRLHLQGRFMRPIWGDAAEVLDYLANVDYHSPGAGA